PWLLLAVFPLCSALAMAVLCRFYPPRA
ncbi:MFS transporter, partial [Cronobacter dublinensis subsp. dublinensis]|nr:MFS transporter [Cronobacter dublinensis subsp. dublinensis]